VDSSRWQEINKRPFTLGIISKRRGGNYAVFLKNIQQRIHPNPVVYRWNIQKNIVKSN